MFFKKKPSGPTVEDTQTYSLWLDLLNAQSRLSRAVEDAEAKRLASLIYPQSARKTAAEYEFTQAQTHLMDAVEDYDRIAGQFRLAQAAEKEQLPSIWQKTNPIASYLLVENEIKHFYKK